jgi:aminoglycoside phosphotransferase (APT) family kinase protein
MREGWTRAASSLDIGEDEAAALLRPALGNVLIAALETLSGGLSNTNIRVALNGAAPVVLRLYQRDPGQARKEAALSRLVAGRVPAPAYLHCGTRSSNGQSYAVVTWVDGVPLQDLARGAGEDDLGRAGASVGQALAAIHSFEFARAGFFDGDLNVTPFPGGFALPDFLADSFAGVAGERLGRDLAAEAVAYAKANDHRSAVWSQPPRLTHFDFGGSNILMRDDFSVAGIVDWEFAASAAPPADFGNLLRPPLGRSAGFVTGVERGYRAANGFLPDDWRALARLADMAAWADFLSRPQASAVLIEDARSTLQETIGN